jgi:predicted alpha/beta hydrolase family esterase
MKVILLHGLNTNPNDKWYPWLAQEMKQRGIEFAAPTLPNPTDPDITAWTAELDKLHPDENTILVGHSRGGVAVLRWLEVQPASLKVKKVILIATNSGFTHKRTVKTESNHGFYTEQGYDFDRIKQHCDDFVILHSKDDQWVPYEAGVENAEGLGARLLTFERKGHFGKGVDEIPELLEEIEMCNIPIYTVHLPEYRIDTAPDHNTLGRLVDNELKKYFTGQTIVARGIGSSEHSGNSIDELIEIIRRDGTDRYDPAREGDRYENIQNKHIDLFGFRRKVTAHTKLFQDIIYGFYHSAISVHGKPTRIDVLIIYDAAKLKAVVHQYEGRTDKKRDGFVFREPDKKNEAVLGIVKVLE